MKRIVTAALVALLLAATAGAQEVRVTVLPSGQTQVETQGQTQIQTQVQNQPNTPQFALTLLTGYFEKNKSNNKESGGITLATGLTITALGAASTAYAFLAPNNYLPVTENERNIIKGVSIGATATGLLIGGIGLAIMNSPDVDYKQKYRYLYEEQDPVVQEAIAYGIMKDLADEAKRARITNGLINVTTPLAILAANALIATAQNDWTDFNSRALKSMAWSIPNMVSGIISLVGGTSRAERLLDSYRSMSASYTGSRY